MAEKDELNNSKFSERTFESEKLMLEDIDEDKQFPSNTIEDLEIDHILENIIDSARKRQHLLNINRDLQGKLLVFIKGSRKKEKIGSEDVYSEADGKPFEAFLNEIDDKADEMEEMGRVYESEIASMTAKLGEETTKLEDSRKEYLDLCEKSAMKAVHSETGKRLSPEEVKDLLAKEESAFEALQACQLQAICKRHDLNAATDVKRNLAEGPLDFAEYEMLRMETQNNKEVALQLRQEIQSIQEKASNIVNTLSHLGQKLHSARIEKSKAAHQETVLQQELNEMRNTLFSEKMKYASMRDENRELQHRFILLQHPKLIEDYYEIQKESEAFHKELENLKKVYSDEIKLINK